MIVISREPGTSVHVSMADDRFIITLAKLLHGERVAASIRQSSNTNPELKQVNTVELTANEPIEFAPGMLLSLVYVRDNKALFGIDAPPQTTIHRLEVYKAIQAEIRKRGPEDGMAGAPVSRPSNPNPPSLDVRLEEPRSPDRSDE